MLISHHRCVCEVEVALIPGCNTFSAEEVAARRHLSSLEPAEPLPRFNYSWRTVSRRAAARAGGAAGGSAPPAIVISQVPLEV